MGELDAARVDVSALLAVARQYRTAADDVEAVVGNELAGLSFDGAGAGRMHAARGDAVRLAIEAIVDQLRAWSRASREIAAVLESSALRYAEADVRAGRGLG